MNRFRKNEKGFTLVELLIVVAIIGILAAIAIPQFVKYKKNASLSACNSDLRNCMNEAAAQFASADANYTNCTAIAGNNLVDYSVAIDADGNATLKDTDGTTDAQGDTISYYDNLSMTLRIDDGAANCTLN